MLKKPLAKILMGVIALSSMVMTTYAANYPVSPYFIFQGGGGAKLDWGVAKWKDMPSFIRGMPIAGGLGVTINPIYTNDWLVSVEGQYHTIIKKDKGTFKEVEEGEEATKTKNASFTEGKVIPILAKLTLPISETKDWFVGASFIGIDLASIGSGESTWELMTNPLKFGIFAEAGGNWHIHNGLYGTLALRYNHYYFGQDPDKKIKKEEIEAKLSPISLNIGMKYNLL